MIRNLLTPKQRHLLWQDEQRDEFILLKGAEVFENGKDTLGCYVWRFKMMPQLRKTGLIFNEQPADECLYRVNIKKADFAAFKRILGTHKRRPYIKGNYLKDLEERLGHRIIPIQTEIGFQEEV